jgi:hypothetical protein
MRTVLVVDRTGVIDPVTGCEQMVVKVMRSPFNVTGADMAKPFALAPAELPAWGTTNAVRERGRLLRERLFSHDGIKQLLQRLEQTPVGEVKPLYVVLKQGDPELFSWETLCTSTDDFVALDKRWPIGRISDPMSAPSRPPPTLRLPVKVMAIISALGVHGQAKEWELFRAALLKTRKLGLEIQLKLLVGDPEMRAAIDKAIAGGLTGVEVSHLDKTGSRVIQEIVGWDPNIVHFFCHGVVEATGKSLELATGSDYTTPGITRGSVRIRSKSLSEMSDNLSNPWLLTLNCCASGQAAKDLQSMAHEVVSAGFPAAVAMLEPVDASDAHEFTRAFYSTVFASLVRVKTDLEKQQMVSFEWVPAMYEARTAISQLHQDHPENSREWTLPVLYVRGIDPLNFFAGPPLTAKQPLTAGQPLSDETARDYKMKARIVAEWLAGTPEELTPEQLQIVMKKALAGVPKEFWPTVDGSFADG